MSSRKFYTEEFKREAVRLCTERGSVSQSTRDLGGASLFYNAGKRR